ncbi:DUF2442 domain-containing protein [Methylomonas sp. SURF-2]|uniref:DUF2442 domain-containing protein n=1 Tax=Methylomonas subterranea TaxID=2952225 RepID=A0ABT1TKW2_9GAMM|nr:DUF2442 domain-containing protein [Methylomonas sp. SURF-2]MCQ8106109.1 DUF2442 domain-containing protein [Methylomonas sp. SURF-2]
MIKIVKAEYLEHKIIRLWFSDQTVGDYDLQPLLDKQTELVTPLQDEVYFKQFFLELGALCWKNGLELSPGNIHNKLRQQGKLQTDLKAA